jgi:hypothetical protein
MNRLTRSFHRLRISNLIQSPALIFIPLAGALAIPAVSLLSGTAAGAALTARQARAAVMYPAYPQTPVSNAAVTRPALLRHPVLHARPPAVTWPQTYTVRPGDSLAAIAQRVYGHAGDWPWVWKTNKDRLAGGVMIMVGQKLKLTRISGPVPAPPMIAAPEPRNPGTAVGATSAQPVQQAPAPVPSPPPGGGILSAAQIGALWLQEGGSGAAEMTAECIAMHESGGNPNAVSPTSDDGLFQEHLRPDVLGNAALSTQVAIQMSGNGTNWSPWTTAASCGV